MSESIQVKTTPTQLPSVSKEQLEIFLQRDPKLGSVLQELEQQESYQAQDKFLTGLVCLEPVSKACLSRLIGLWQDPPKASQATSEELQHEISQRVFSLQSFAREFSELLGAGLSHYFAETPSPSAPAKAEPECEVKKDAVGNISVECTVPGNFK